VAIYRQGIKQNDSWDEPIRRNIQGVV